jgi:hypothetical protein
MALCAVWSSGHARSYACRGWKTAAWAGSTVAGQRRRRCLQAVARTAPTPGSGASPTFLRMVRQKTEVPTPRRRPPGSMPI